MALPILIERDVDFITLKNEAEYFKREIYLLDDKFFRI